MKKRRDFFRASVFLATLVSCSAAITPEAGSENPPNPKQKVEEALAFPGAEGFARAITGGRGGKVQKVTNLQDSGPGSLRAAIEQSGPRIIVFDISGTIELKSALRIKSGDVTLAGQTAPGDGICLKDYPLVIESNNVIIRFMRFRMGDAAQIEGDALSGIERKNILIDHCSMSWSTDECVSFYNNDYFTLQWCVIAESLRNSAHSKGNHGYGGIWGGKFASFHHNVLAHHDSRNPRLGERAGSSYALTDLVDIRNNVIYNWGSNSCYGGEAMNVNIVNNYYKPGPATNRKERIIAIDKNLNETTAIFNRWGKFFIDGNVLVGSTRATLDNWKFGVINQFHERYGVIPEAEIAEMRRLTPHDIQSNVRTQTAEEAYQSVLKYAGASLVRDLFDTRILKEVATGTVSSVGSRGSKNGIIDSPQDSGGWPVLKTRTPEQDTDRDGMPDVWEDKMGLNKNEYDAHKKTLSTAYDNIEVFTHSLVEHIMKHP